MNNKNNSRKSLIDKVNDNGNTKPKNSTSPYKSSSQPVNTNKARSSLSQKVQSEIKPKTNDGSSNLANRQLHHRSVEELNTRSIKKPSTHEIASKLRSQQINEIKPSNAEEKIKVDRNALAQTVANTSNENYHDDELDIDYDYVPEPIPQTGGSGNGNKNNNNRKRKFKNKYIDNIWYAFFGTKIESKPLRYFDYFLRVSLVGFVLVFFVSAFVIISSPHQFTKELIYRPNDTMVYDKNKKLVGKIIQKREDGANVENISYDQMNQSIISSVVGTEDSTFFTHHGFDLLNTAENGFKSVILKKGSAGGSSITQQIIGETHVGRIGNSSITRKIREIFLSGIAETQLDKSTILTSYLNYFDFGQGNVRGIELASKYFFDKSVTNSDYVQSAILVGTLNAPTAYNPLGGYIGETYVNNSQRRLANVLLSNKNQGYLQDPEYYLLQQVQIADVVDINKSVVATNPYQDYIDVVAQELEEKYKVDPYTKSLKVYTTMDRKAQKYAHELTMKKHVGVVDSSMNFGFIVTKTQTGEITALSGGKQYRKGGASLFNNATDNKQQPGSSFKPIIDYSPTFEFLKWGDRTPISNAKYYWADGTEVYNVDKTSGGVMTMDKAIAMSRNLTAIRAMEAVTDKVGFDKLTEYLNKLGFKFSKNEVVPAYALGGLAHGVTPKEMNGAYQAFGNGGYYIEPYTITSYTDDEGKNEVKNTTKKERVISEQTAFLTSTTLERSTKVPGAYISTANYTASPYAAKTGTSNWDESGAQYGIPNLSPRDTWFVGYTTEYTMSAWGGYDAKEIKKGKYPNFYNGTHDYSAKLWGAMMTKLATGKEKSWLDMKLPDGIVKQAFDPTQVPPYKQSYYSNEYGYFFADNSPSGYSNNIDTSNLSASITAIKGSVTATFTRRPEDYEGVLVVGGNETSTTKNSITLKVSDYDTVSAYVLGSDNKKYGLITKCYYDGKLYNTCPVPEVEKEEPETNNDTSQNENTQEQEKEETTGQETTPDTNNNNNNTQDHVDED